MNNWGANHCVMTAGHVGHLYISLAAMLRIPVYMHNVEEDRIFRPSAWRALVLPTSKAPTSVLVRPRTTALPLIQCLK